MEDRFISLSICKNIDSTTFNPVVSASSSGKFKEYVQSLGFKFFDITLPKIFRSGYLRKLHDIVVSEGIDIIHAHGGVAGMYAGFYKKKYNDEVKIIHTLHGIHYIHSKNLFRKKLSLYIERHLVKYIDLFICVSNDDFNVGSELKIIKPGKSTVIYNGIDLKRFKSLNRDVKLNIEFGIKETDFVIGNISRFDEQKNQRLLVEIMPALIKKIPAIKLILVGDGDLLNSVKLLSDKLDISDKVIFAGSRNDVNRFYPAFDVFVFPSLWEGLSLTLLEALASGSCIISSNIPSNRELIRDDVNGVLFDLNNKKHLIENIVDLFNNKDKRSYLSKGAVESSKIFDEKIMTEKIEDLYYNLIKN